MATIFRSVYRRYSCGPGAGRSILLLPEEGGRSRRLIGHFEQKRSRTAGRVIHRGVRGNPSSFDAENLSHDAADLCRGIEELAFAIDLRGEVPHQVLVGIAKDVVAIGTVLGEVERRIVKDCDHVGESIHHLLAAAEFGAFAEIWEIREIVGFRHLYRECFDEDNAYVYLEISGVPFEAASVANLAAGEGLSSIAIRLPEEWARKVGLIES